MEKIKLNNQVVQMRKYVKQAKVHIINKLVKEIKLLQNRKGNEVQIQKAKRKAERFLEEVALLKKIKPDDVSKLALSKAKDWKHVLQQKNSTLADRCIALLVNYGAVQKEVEAFHSSNKELVLKITDLIEQWEKKNKNSKDSVKVKNMSNVKKTDNNIHKVISKDKESLKKIDSHQKSSLINKNNETKKNNCLEQNKKSNVKPFVNAASNKLVEKELCGNNCDDSSCDVENTSEVNKDPAENSSKINEGLMETEVSDSDNEEEVIENDDDAGNASEDKDPAQNSSKISENSTETEKTDSDNEEEVIENDDDVENASEDDKGPAQNSSNISENSIETEKTDSDNEEEMIENCSTSKDIAENEKELISPGNKCQQSSVASKFAEKTQKMDNSAENKLKEITLLNLDDLQGVDEIPVNSIIKSDKSDEEMTEKVTGDIIYKKRNDPFFLGCGGDEMAEKLINSPKDEFISRCKKPFSNAAQTPKRTEFFKRQEKSDWSSHKKTTRKFLDNPRKNSVKFKNDQDNFKSFKKNKFLSKNYEDKYQEKSKNTFNRDSTKDFDMKHKMHFSREESIYRRKKHDGNSNDLYLRNEGDNFPGKSKVPHKKDNTSNKALHPSWEAKKKQKELINTSFQGRRMVFED